MGFTKLDSGILQSSIMAEPPETFKIFIAILASCGPDGIAKVSSTYLAAACYFPLEVVDSALAALEAPDPRSRSLVDDGRRIRRVDGGYLVVNYEKYRGFSPQEGDPNSPGALRTRRWREKKQRHEASQGVSQAVTGSPSCDAESVTYLPIVTHGDVTGVTSASASSSASSSHKGKSGEKGSPGLPYIEKVSEVFSRANYRFDDRTIIYIANLCAEFPELDHEAELKSKMAWWVNHPITPKSNVCLQVRNWFLIARERLEERRAHARVGNVGRHPEARTHEDQAAFEKFRDDYMRAHHIDSIDDIDPFKFPSFKEYLALKAKNPAVLGRLLGEGK